MSATDDYLDDLQPAEKVALERVRAVVAGLAPDASEGTSYGVPAFIYAGRPLLGFSATKMHLSIFPFSPAAIETVKERLDGFDLAKGTIRFSPDTPVPADVLADLIRARKQQIATKRWMSAGAAAVRPSERSRSDCSSSSEATASGCGVMRRAAGRWSDGRSVRRACRRHLRDWDGMSGVRRCSSRTPRGG